MSLDRRRPDQSKLLHKERNEIKFSFYRVFWKGKDYKTSIGFIIENEIKESTDYDHLKATFRPSHTDFTYQQSMDIDFRGGGDHQQEKPSIGLLQGAIAKQILPQIKINAYVSSGVYCFR